MQATVKQAILAMRDRYFEPITLRELASEVFVSPFHFARVFSRDVGVTPGQYLTAIRMFEAKRLLLTTTLTVSDIVCSVGYSSVGTFTTRFTKSVGMTPTQYREPEVGELLVAVAHNFHRFPSLEVLRGVGRTCVSVPTAAGGSIVGTLQLPREAATANVLVGVFADVIPQCGPVAFTGLRNGGSAELAINNVPAGSWTVIAVAEPGNGGSESGEAYIGIVRQPVTVATGRESRITLRMRAVTTTDPPIAITLASRAALNSDRISVRRRTALRAVA